MMTPSSLPSPTSPTASPAKPLKGASAGTLTRVSKGPTTLFTSSAETEEASIVQETHRGRVLVCRSMESEWDVSEKHYIVFIRERNGEFGAT